MRPGAGGTGSSARAPCVPRPGPRRGGRRGGVHRGARPGPGRRRRRGRARRAAPARRGHPHRGPTGTRHGLVWLKAFPAVSLGPAWFKAVAGPLPEARFVATGGARRRQRGRFPRSRGTGGGRRVGAVRPHPTGRPSQADPQRPVSSPPRSPTTQPRSCTFCPDEGRESGHIGDRKCKIDAGGERQRGARVAGLRHGVSAPGCGARWGWASASMLWCVPLLDTKRSSWLCLTGRLARSGLIALGAALTLAFAGFTPPGAGAAAAPPNNPDRTAGQPPAAAGRAPPSP